jgi:hypothetical protein
MCEYRYIKDHTNRSLAMSNRVSDAATWILKTADQRLTPKIGRMPPTIQKITPQRLRNVLLTPGNLVPNLATRTEHIETGLPGWGGRTRTSEWRNQNPPNSRVASEPILKNKQNPIDCLSMGWLVFQNESLVSSLLATTGMGSRSF